MNKYNELSRPPPSDTHTSNVEKDDIQSVMDFIVRRQSKTSSVTIQWVTSSGQIAFSWNLVLRLSVYHMISSCY